MVRRIVRRKFNKKDYEFDSKAKCPHCNSEIMISPFIRYLGKATCPNPKCKKEVKIEELKDFTPLRQI